MDSQVSRMDNRWTLHIEDFGKIRTADITVAPLTLFVGDNNSGKSYLMTLLYTLLRLQMQDWNLCEESLQYQRCVDWLLASIQESSSYADVLFSGDAFQNFEKLLNLVLMRNKEDICRLAFGRDVPIGKLSVSFPADVVRYLHIRLGGNTADSGSYYSDSQWYFDYSDKYERIFFNSGAVISAQDDNPTPGELKFVIAYLLECLLKWGFSADISHHTDVAFLPISRTGFLYTYPSLTGTAVSKVYGFSRDNGLVSRSPLTKPYSDFLTALATVNSDDMDSRNNEIASFIETTMIHGAVTVSDNMPIPEYSYRPMDSNQCFSMSLSSGVVTELAPLLLFLRHTPMQTLFIEEPEISLHPALQQAMARVLVRLSNQGTPVLVTTHNNTIIQHINNMIRLSHISDETRDNVLKKFHFDHSDLIDEESITMCQFDIDGEDRTTVHELSGDEYGFVVPTFVDALTKMLDQSRAARQDLK